MIEKGMLYVVTQQRLPENTVTVAGVFSGEQFALEMERILNGFEGMGYHADYATVKYGRYRYQAARFYVSTHSYLIHVQIVRQDINYSFATADTSILR